MAHSQTPLEHFLLWFESVPPDHQRDIASGASFLPGFESVQRVDDHSDIPHRFIEIVRSYSVKESKLGEKAAVIALRYLGHDDLSD